MTFAMICGFVYRPQSALMDSSKILVVSSNHIDLVGCGIQSMVLLFSDNMSDLMVSFWNRLRSSRICLVSPEGGIYNFWSSGPLDWASYSPSHIYILYYIILYYIILYYIMLCYVILYYIILYHIISYYII